MGSPSVAVLDYYSKVPPKKQALFQIFFKKFLPPHTRTRGTARSLLPSGHEQAVYCRIRAELGYRALGLRKALRRRALRAIRALDRADEQVLRRMLHLYELEELRAVAAVFEDVCAHGVGEERREALLYQSVAREEREAVALYL